MSAANSGRLLALLALTIVVLVAPMETEAIFHKVFGANNNNNNNKLEGATESAAGANRAQSADFDYDSDSDSEDESELEPRAPTPASKTRANLPARVDSSATRAGPTKTRPGEPAESQPGRAKVRRPKDAAQEEGRHAHGRTLRNQLRRAGKPVGSYLDEEDADWQRDDGEADQDDRRIKGRARDKQRASQPRDGKRPAKASDGPTVDDDHDEEEADEEADNRDASSRAKAGRDALARAKYVSTGPSGSGKSKAAREELLSRINLSRPVQGDKPGGGGGAKRKKKKKKQPGVDLISKEFWQKSFTSVAKATNKGLKATKKALADLPRDLRAMLDKVNIMDKRAAKAAKLVRSEFAKFTIEWARIMEEGLDYLGDKDLDRVVWDDTDELDLRKDALHSLVIGYEFMRLMIIWRENMLLAHEGFRVWLEKARLECEKDKSLDIMTDFGYSPDEAYNYIQLMAWDFIKYDGLEAQLNLDYLMDLEDSRPKNYMSRFFRNIVVLQETYFPTMRALEEERKAVRLPPEELTETYDFFMDYRQMVAEGLFDDVDIEAPKEMADFVAKMTPQLRLNGLVYSKSHVKSLAAKMEQAKANRQSGLASIYDEEEDEEGDEYDSDYEE